MERLKSAGVRIALYFVPMVFLFCPIRAGCVDFEPGLITKIVDRYVAVNIGEEQGISPGDTLWVFREQESGQKYMGIIRIMDVREKMSGAEVLVVREGEKLEVLDRVGLKPLSISLLDDIELDNFSLISGIKAGTKGTGVEEGERKETSGLSGRNKMMPEVILFTIGGVGIGVSAMFAGLAVYNDYKYKYEDDPLMADKYLGKYQDYRNMRNVAMISTAAILGIAAISHFLSH